LGITFRLGVLLFEFFPLSGDRSRGFPLIGLAYWPGDDLLKINHLQAGTLDATVESMVVSVAAPLKVGWNIDGLGDGLDSARARRQIFTGGVGWKIL
jgi:hypothetical protein